MRRDGRWWVCCVFGLGLLASCDATEVEPADGEAPDVTIDAEPPGFDAAPEPEPDMAPELDQGFEADVLPDLDGLDARPDPEPDQGLDPDMNPEPDMTPEPEPDMSMPDEPHPCGDAFPLTIADLDFPAEIVQGEPGFEASVRYTGDPRRAENRLIVALRYELPGVSITTYDFQTEAGDDCVMRFQHRGDDPGDPVGETVATFRVIDALLPPDGPDWDPPASNDLMQPLTISPPR